VISGQTPSIRIYNSIKQSLPSEVKQFNLWNNQISKLKEGTVNPVRFPAVFISFENEYNQLSLGRQEINGTFVLHLCLQSLKHDDTDILLWKDYLYQSLSDQLPKNGFSDFYRRFEVQDTDFDNLIIWQQEYSYSYIDDATRDERNNIIVNPFRVEGDVHY
jgi:hypothetical protein